MSSSSASGNEGIHWPDSRANVTAMAERRPLWGRAPSVPLRRPPHERFAGWPS